MMKNTAPMPKPITKAFLTPNFSLWINSPSYLIRNKPNQQRVSDCPKKAIKSTFEFLVSDLQMQSRSVCSSTPLRQLLQPLRISLALVWTQSSQPEANQRLSVDRKHWRETTVNPYHRDTKIRTTEKNNRSFLEKKLQNALIFQKLVRFDSHIHNITRSYHR